MWAFLFSTLLISSPFDFEAKQGLSFEGFVGSNLIDRWDSQTGNLGIRLSYLTPDEKDAFICPEFSVTYQWTLEKETGYPRSKTLLEPAIVFYEIFNPFALRVALAGGIERRHDDWRGLMGIRPGIGYLVFQSMSAWFDISQRIIFRKQNSFPLDISLGTQFVF